MNQCCLQYNRLNITVWVQAAELLNERFMGQKTEKAFKSGRIKLLNGLKNVESSKKKLGIVAVSATLTSMTDAKSKDMIILEKRPLKST